MAKNTGVPFDLELAQKIAAEFGTPIHIYDESGIRKTAKDINMAFKWAKGYKNFFAVKATPTPAILRILHEEGMGFDCSSNTELVMMERLAIPGEDIFFTSNNTPFEDFELAIKLGATINIDDITQIPVFLKALGNRKLSKVAVRYNPGDLKEGNQIIGQPTEAKYGMTSGQLVDAFNLLKQANISEFGLHSMVASNELKPEYFAETADIVLDAVKQIEATCNANIGFINLGGGFGLNYSPDQEPLDLVQTSRLIQEVLARQGKSVRLFTENGRYVTGPHGYLLSKVRYVMEKYKGYIGIDASMHNLMRPGMYGAYHHITILGDNEETRPTIVYDVVGSLCENNDKFAIDRELPQVKEGDLMVIHDTGAHGHAMGFNYNGLLKSGEVLITEAKEPLLIRRAETVEDYFSTAIW